MGWHRVTSLDLRTNNEPAMIGKVYKSPALWTRGGIEGLEVHLNDIIISIPREAIEMLVGEEIKSARISAIENADPNELYNELKKG